MSYDKWFEETNMESIAGVKGSSIIKLFLMNAWNAAIKESAEIAETEPLKVENINTLCSCGKAIAKKIRSREA